MHTVAEKEKERSRKRGRNKRVDGWDKHRILETLFAIAILVEGTFEEVRKRGSNLRHAEVTILDRATRPLRP